MVVTDLVYRDIREHIANHAPERGGALYGPKGYPLVTHFEYDSEAATTAVSYVPSTRLIVNVPKVELETGLQFKGIVHSHPHGMTRPSGGDEHTVASFFRLNPHVSLMALPIVQQAYANDSRGKHDFLYWYRAERQRETTNALEDKAASSDRLAKRSTDRVKIIAEEYHILPILKHVEIVNSHLETWGLRLNISQALQHLKVHNAELVGLVATSAEGFEFMFFATLDYPITAPIIFYQRRGETQPLLFPWNGISNPTQCLQDIAELLREEWIGGAMRVA